MSTSETELENISEKSALILWFERVASWFERKRKNVGRWFQNHQAILRPYLMILLIAVLILACHFIFMIPLFVPLLSIVHVEILATLVMIGFLVANAISYFKFMLFNSDTLGRTFEERALNHKLLIGAYLVAAILPFIL